MKKTTNRGPASPAPFFIALVLAAVLLAQAGCTEWLEDSGRDPSKPEPHELSPLVPWPEDRSDAEEKLPIVTPDKCRKITDLTNANMLIEVDRVVDGDTLRASNVREPLRLWSIDAPEADQPGGWQAKEYLESMVAPGDVLLAQNAGTDRYGRILVVLTGREGQNINHRMVEMGWAFPYYGPGEGRNACLESAKRHAQSTKQGVWRIQRYGGVRPWEWRQGIRR